MEGKGDIDSKEYSDTIVQLSMIAPHYFTDSGEIINIKLLHMEEWKFNNENKLFGTK